MIVSALRAALMAVPLAAMLAGCVNRPPFACPPVYILGDAKDITRYRPGGGRDVTDVELTARISGWRANCGYKPTGPDTWDVDMDLEVGFVVKRGPAGMVRTAEISYFVAIPAFHPKPSAKEVFPLSITYPDASDAAALVDMPVRLTIPVRAKDVIDNYAIYIGLQATAAELEYNRTRK